MGGGGDVAAAEHCVFAAEMKNFTLEALRVNTFRSSTFERSNELMACVWCVSMISLECKKTTKWCHKHLRVRQLIVKAGSEYNQ